MDEEQTTRSQQPHELSNLHLPSVIETHSAEETRALGVRIATLLRPGMVIALHGDLGAGKTTLTQGIAAGLGIQQRVTSPTFTLVNEYELGRAKRLIHIDSYRLENADAETIGLDEILADEEAIVIIEWAERVADYLPDDAVQIRISAVSEDTRRIEIVRVYQ